MASNSDPVKDHARELFSHLKDPWPSHDRWSRHTSTNLAALIAEFATISEGKRILNVGSHGNSYGLHADNQIHLDIAEPSMTGVALAVVGDAETLPFGNEVFDFTLCVGSVINYCSAAAAIAEMGRTLKKSGRLLLEFETSDSLEFMLTPDIGKDVALVRTFYNRMPDRLYVYSCNYISAALRANKMEIDQVRRFHLLSPLAYRLTRSERVASRFARYDNLAQRLPLLGRYSANVTLSAHKN